MKLHKIEFTKCEIVEVDFGRADLTGSSFNDCDLRKAHNYIIDPENNKISKAKFSLIGVPGLLTKYDIVIE